MSFILSATKALLPPLPSGYPSLNLSEMWIGQGTDANMLVFRAGSQWRMVRNNVSSSEATGSAAMLPAVVVNGSKLYPIFRDCGGYLYFSNGSRTLWFVEGIGWVYMADGAPGYVPEEYTNEDGATVGDNFYVVQSFRYSDGAIITLKPRGALSGGTDLQATFSWQRWDGPTTGLPFGSYEGKEGASGTKEMGCPRWKDSSGNTYIRSLEKVLGRWNYGAIHYENGKWLIGSVGAVNGWYEGSEPSLTSSVIFRFCKPEGSEVMGSDRTVTFVDRVEGENTAEVLLGEVAIWHS